MKILRYANSLLIVNKIVIFFIVSFIHLGCSNNNVDKVSVDDAQRSYFLESSGVIKRFNLPERAINRSRCLIPYTDKESNLLYYLSEYTNMLIIFDLDKSIIDTVLTFQREGPNGFGSVNGFEIINRDSLLITSFFQQAILISNSSAERIGVINYRKYNNLNFVNDGVSKTLGNMRMHFQQNQIYIPFFPSVNESVQKENTPQDLRFVAILDTANKSVSTMDIGFPKDYWSKHLFSAFFSFFNFNNQFYLSYDHYDSIYSSTDGKVWKGYLAKSEFLDLNKSVEPKHGKLASYLHLVPDPYRKVFYRFVRHEQLDQTRSDTELIRYPRNFSIIILDSNLNMVGETVFPEDTYDPHGYFVGKEGLYLSKSHIYNPGYDENILEFELFSVKENEKY